MKPPTPEEIDLIKLRSNIEHETARQWLPVAALLAAAVILAAAWWLL